MERNIRMVIAYDGTDFHGWQTQPGLRTVQYIVEQAVRRVVRHQVALHGASRTDAGVHAQGQIADFLTTCSIPINNLRLAIGCRLPKDVSIQHVREVPADFRASTWPVSKLYRYRIHNHARRPVEEHLQRYTYHFWHPLAVDRMQQAANHLIGKHDFAALASSGHQRQSTVRTILRCEVYRHYREVRIDVEGTGFLYNQVRNIVGTLVEIGRGHWPAAHMPEILACRDRSQAGPTAPPRGLCLQWIRYDLTANQSDANHKQPRQVKPNESPPAPNPGLSDPSEPRR